MIDTPCVIFIGGKSSRMGKDKAFLPFNENSTLLEYQYKRLKNIFYNVYISCKEKTVLPFKAKIIYDIVDNIYAPTVGFVSCYKALHVNKFFVISVDTPFITEDEINTLFYNDSDFIDATIAKTKDKIHPLCGIYHKSLQDNFEQMLKDNNHKLQTLLQSSNIKYIDFKDNTKFFNINNPSQYHEALKQLTYTLV